LRLRDIFDADLKASKRGTQVSGGRCSALETICMSFLFSSPNYRVERRLAQRLIELLLGELDGPLRLILFVNVFNRHLRVDCVQVLYVCLDLLLLLFFGYPLSSLEEFWVLGR
jgi:hypothetical protein